MELYNFQGGYRFLYRELVKKCQNGQVCSSSRSMMNAGTGNRMPKIVMDVVYVPCPMEESTA